MKQFINGTFGMLLVVLAHFVIGYQALSQESAIYIVTSTQNINGRACARLDCAVLTTFDPGSSVVVIDSVEGASVLGSTMWYQIEFEGQAVYIHSSLVARESTESSNTSAVAAVDTSQWNAYQGSGFSIMAPSDWVGFTADEAFIELTVESAKMAGYANCTRCESNLRSYMENSIVLTHPRLLGLTIIVTPAFVGIDFDLHELQAFLNGATFADDTTLVSSEIVEMPEGPVLRTQTRLGDDPIYGMVVYDYVFFRSGIGFYIQVSGPLTIEDLEASLEAIVSSFKITNIEAVRAALTLDGGVVGIGDYSGELLAGKRQVWTYDAVAGDVLTISTFARTAYPTGPDTLLTIYAPDGSVVAANNDNGFLNWDLNAKIQNLKFIEDGPYLIEVAAPSFDYADGRYSLRLENTSVQPVSELSLAITPMGEEIKG